MGRTTNSEQPTKRNPARRTKKIKIVTVAQCSDQEKFLLLKEKNRESAQRSRDNRKKYITGLENRVSELVLENEYLRKQLSLCHCSREEPSMDNNITNATEQSPASVEIEPEPSVFERVSVKSYFSCSNFLMLALVMMFCVFGFVDVTGDTVRQPTGLYSMSSLETALTSWSGAMPSCKSQMADNGYMHSIREGIRKKVVNQS